NTLPKCNSGVKKILCLVGVDYNDALVFQVWGVTLKKKDGDSSSEVSTKGPPMKVLWYLPISLRFKQFFC
ncbi:hypothetical protein CR513_27376, partial [Mucuna pruriens]